jgi:hypothetical protein
MFSILVAGRLTSRMNDQFYFANSSIHAPQNSSYICISDPKKDKNMTVCDTVGSFQEKKYENMLS